MSDCTFTKVWEVNGKLVVADSVQKAIEIYLAYCDVPITLVRAVSSSKDTKDYEALIRREQA